MGIFRELAHEPRVRSRIESSRTFGDLRSRFVADESPDRLRTTLADLISKGLLVSVQRLDRPAQSSAQADAALTAVQELLTQLRDWGIARESEVVIATAPIGVQSKTGAQLVDDLHELAKAARNVGARLNLHVGQHDPIDALLAVHEKVRQDFPDFAITVQTALQRSLIDVQELAAAGARVQLSRSVRERDDEASFEQLDAKVAYVTCLRTLLEAPQRGHGPQVCIATHDPQLINVAEKLVGEPGSRTDYEFKMSFGIRPLEARRLADVGHPVRVQVPFGQGWYDYLTELMDHPANAKTFARALIGRR